MKRAFLSGLASLLVAIALAEPGGAAEWTVRGNVPPDQFIIQSHRGAGELAPENTIEAFELGWKLGTIPESDVRTTKDGVIVAFHDANFKRTVKGASPELQKKGVVDITYAELLKLDVGGWKGEEFQGRRVSRLMDVFERMRGKPDRRLYLDIKNVDLKNLAAEVKQAGVSKQVILASTVYDVIREWKRLLPDSQTLLWMGGKEEELKNRFAELRIKEFADVTQLQIHVRMNTNNVPAGTFTPSPEFLRGAGGELRKHGILFQSLPWGVTDARVYWQLLDLGVASFATDHPKETREAVNKFYAGENR